MKVEPYLFFDGRCEEALTFYAEKLGAQVLFKMRNKEAPPEHARTDEYGDRIMHASFKIGETMMMASDGIPEQPVREYTGFAVSIGLDDPAKGEQMFNALAEGGKVGFPWQATFWAKGFGMVHDKFGIPWMINVE